MLKVDCRMRHILGYEGMTAWLDVETCIDVEGYMYSKGYSLGQIPDGVHSGLQKYTSFVM